VEHVTLPAFDDDGRLAISEMLEVEPIGQGRYRLLHSPAFVEGIAGGDIIELDHSATTGFRIVARGRNLAVIAVVETDSETFSPEASTLCEAVLRLGGTCDGGPARVLVFTVPVSAGFGPVEKAMSEFTESLAGATWWYGNVYENGDENRPLNWW
jgi:hypothetical protein